MELKIPKNKMIAIGVIAIIIISTIIGITIFSLQSQSPIIRSKSPEGNVTIEEGQSQLFSVDAYDPKGAALSYVWKANTTILDSTTSNYTFVSDYTSAGIYNIEVKISNGKKRNISQ